MCLVSGEEHFQVVVSKFVLSNQTCVPLYGNLNMKLTQMGVQANGSGPMPAAALLLFKQWGIMQTSNHGCIS